MPAAAAPIISSVQKLVLYETRAVSSLRSGARRGAAGREREDGDSIFLPKSLIPALGMCLRGLRLVIAPRALLLLPLHVSI